MRRTSFREGKKKKRKRSSPIFKSSLATPRGIRGESEERVRSFVRVEDEEETGGGEEEERETFSPEFPKFEFERK